jgi:hypothetical protein
MANLQNVGVSRSASSYNPGLPAYDGGNPRPLSAADLMANLQRNSQSPIAQTNVISDKRQSIPTPAAAQQDFLLHLLKPSSRLAQSGNAADSALPTLAASSEPHHSPVPHFGSPSIDQTVFEAPQPTKPSRFNYINPFDELHSSSPLNAASNPKASPSNPQTFEILKHARDTSVSQAEELLAPVAKAKKAGAGDTASQGATDSGSTSVSKALQGVGEKADKEAEQALTAAESKDQSRNDSSSAALPTRQKEQKVPADTDEVGSSWESAEDDEASVCAVDVYNFPMKPFVSLQIKQMPEARPIRQDNFMVVAQLKKDFDQIDRCLVTASQTHIIYAQVATKKDNGGFRVIRQDNGQHKQVFRSSGERIFNVQLCSTNVRGDDVETVLGTGVNGSIFWTSLNKSRGDLFEDDDVESQGFVMPPVATIEENTSGSPVKTRAKMSSRHPAFFGVARGKQIYIIAPDAAKQPQYCPFTTRKVDSDKFFQERSLKINTGKAGKDFCFSEDDSVIVSLDKTGRFKFWDIRELTSQITTTNGRQEPVELREPMWTMNAAASGSKPDEKPSVSSIMFLDKERPTVKGTALRYMIIGFKQNHILQLWDLGLGKAVQEIRLPHEKDSDGICSISYHAKSGIITVGHPTRNSIYFIHLSAPKYPLQAMEQAKYIALLAREDSKLLPRPESTAIMSGLREFSFAKVGQLRSVDMLKTPVENASEGGSTDETLFELYIMHSRGVVGVPIKREDLGWDAAGKMVNPKDALAEGVIDISELIQPHKLPALSEQGTADNATKQNTKPGQSKKEDLTKSIDASKIATLTSRPEAKRDTPVSNLNNHEPKHSQATTSAPENRPTEAAGPNEAQGQSQDIQSQLTAQTAGTQRGKSPSKTKPTSSTANVAKKALPPPTSASAQTSITSDEFQSLLNKQSENLYQRIDNERRAQDASAGAKQEALLRLVSSTLTDNVDRSLNHIVSNSIQQEVLPMLNDIISKVIDRNIADSLPQHLSSSIQTALKGHLPSALQNALKEKDFHRSISETTANQVANKVQAQVSTLLQQALPNMATQASLKLVADLEQRMSQKLQLAETERKADAAKIDGLISIVNRMSVTMESLSDLQSATQDALLKMQRDVATVARASVSRTSPTVPAEEPRVEGPVELQSDPEDEEVARITQTLLAKEYENATIQVKCPQSFHLLTNILTNL